MKKTLILLLFLFCFAFSGCMSRSKAPGSPICRVVTEITVQAKRGTEDVLWCYSEPKKMIKLLNYLRHLELWDSADPEISAAPHYRITLHLSDGRQKTYDQIGTDYIRIGDGPWLRIPEDQGIRLSLLLTAVSSDAI